ncbi:MAG: Peptidyl-prolyl cis-trans isomerase [Parcubacteria group bacterium GW2011_GWA2_47_7]|nr:MAG: Peptidyl-prolyl cis-trans isomerase [Parcubacteria group bacterium GW2011_GWA2_47_7]
MHMRKLTLDEIVYWGILLFAAVSIGYLLITLIDLSLREETSFSQSTYIKRQASTVNIRTSEGEIRITLLRAVAPVTSNNFASLVQSGFYDQTKFHRIVKGLLVQAGDPLSREDDRALYGTGGPGYVFDDELRGVKMERGVVAMANLGRPKTNGSQFFILVQDEAPLMDGKYTIFGKVEEGMDVVDKINAVSVDEHDIPLKPVIISEINIE